MIALLHASSRVGEFIAVATPLALLIGASLLLFFGPRSVETDVDRSDDARALAALSHLSRPTVDRRGPLSERTRCVDGRLRTPAIVDLEGGAR